MKPKELRSAPASTATRCWAPTKVGRMGLWEGLEPRRKPWKHRQPCKPELRSPRTVWLTDVGLSGCWDRETPRGRHWASTQQKHLPAPAQTSATFLAPGEPASTHPRGCSHSAGTDSSGCGRVDVPLATPSHSSPLQRAFARSWSKVLQRRKAKPRETEGLPRAPGSRGAAGPGVQVPAPPAHPRLPPAPSNSPRRPHPRPGVDPGRLGCSRGSAQGRGEAHPR